MPKLNMTPEQKAAFAAKMQLARVTALERKRADPDNYENYATKLKRTTVRKRPDKYASHKNKDKVKTVPGEEAPAAAPEKKTFRNKLNEWL